MSTNLESAASLACRINVLGREITAAAGRLLAPFGVTPAQAHVYYHLLQGEGSPSAMAKSIGIDASSLSRLLRTLENLGHLERAIDPENRTRIQLALTEAGERVARQIDPHALQIQERIEKALAPQELATVHRALAAISEAMEPIGDRPLATSPELTESV